MNKTLWYQSMAASDVMGLLSVTQVRDFLEVRHPIAAKKHKVPEAVLPENDTPV